MFSRKFFVPACVAAALAAVFALGFILGNIGLGTFPSEGGSASGEEPFEPLTLETVERGESARVSRVIDGDTVELVGGERLRLIGIDAPERGACFFTESQAALAALVSGKEFSLVRDISDRDRYGRLLRYIYTGDLFINLAMVEQGAATAYRYSPDIAHTDEFSVAESRAKSRGLGLWSSCTGDISVDPRSNQRESASTGCVIKGNISSSGEKIYHIPGCGSYEKTYIDEAKGEAWFCSESVAQSEDFRRASNCP